MKKSTIEMLYAIIFVLSVILYAVSMWKYIISQQDWFTFGMSPCIMFLSLWGYLIVKLYFKVPKKTKSTKSKKSKKK